MSHSTRFLPLNAETIIKPVDVFKICSERSETRKTTHCISKIHKLYKNIGSSMINRGNPRNSKKRTSRRYRAGAPTPRPQKAGSKREPISGGAFGKDTRHQSHQWQLYGGLRGGWAAGWLALSSKSRTSNCLLTNTQPWKPPLIDSIDRFD